MDSPSLADPSACSALVLVLERRRLCSAAGGTLLLLLLAEAFRLALRSPATVADAVAAAVAADAAALSAPKRFRDRRFRAAVSFSAGADIFFAADVSEARDQTNVNVRGVTLPE
jgi:hypothetical protein